MLSTGEIHFPGRGRGGQRPMSDLNAIGGHPLPKIEVVNIKPIEERRRECEAVDRNNGEVEVKSRGQARIEDTIDLDSELFRGSSITKADLLKVLQAIQAKHKSTRASTDDLLNLVSAIFPDFEGASAKQLRGYLRRVTRLLDHVKVYHLCKCQEYIYRDENDPKSCPKCGERRFQDNHRLPRKQQVIPTCKNGCSIFADHHFVPQTSQYLYKHANNSRCDECEMDRHDVVNVDTAVMIEYDRCVNDCTVYFNHGQLSGSQLGRQRRNVDPNEHFQNRSRLFMYANDRKCSICGAYRYKMGTEPWNVYRHISLVGQLQDILLHETMAKALLLPVDRHGGDDVQNIYQSRMWQKSIVEDTEFSKERRNMALVLCSDGANPFKTAASYTPIMIEILNAPEHVRKKKDSIILVGLCGPSTNMIVVLDIVVDELHLLYYQGCVMEYHDGAKFVFRTKLVFTVGDYPGQCKMGGFSGHTHGSGCNKCLARGVTIGRTKLVVRTAKRFLPHDHPKRLADPSIGFPPRRRSSSVVAFEGKLVRKKQPTPSGVVAFSPLARLGYFDLVRDMPIDIMHLVQGVFKNHLIPVFKGDKDCGELLRSSLPLQQSAQNVIDARFSELKLPSNVCRLSNKPFLHTGQMTAYDFQVVFTMLGKTLFHDIFTDKRIYDLLCRLQEVFRCILNHTVTLSLLPALRQRIVEALVLWEDILPDSQQNTVPHILLHVCDDMQYFGPVRNYWMYCFERYISLLSRWAKSKRFVGASILQMYCCSRTFIRAKPEFRGRLKEVLSKDDPFGIGLASTQSDHGDDNHELKEGSQVVCSRRLCISRMSPQVRALSLPSSVQLYITHMLRQKCTPFDRLYVEFLTSKSRRITPDISGFDQWQKLRDGRQALQSFGFAGATLTIKVEDFACAKVNLGNARARGVLFRTSVYERHLDRKGSKRSYTDSYCWFFHKTLGEKWYGEIKYLLRVTMREFELKIAVLERLQLFESEVNQWQVFQGEYVGHRVLHLPPDVARPVVCCPIKDLKRLVVADIPTDDLYWVNYKIAIEVDTSSVATSDSM
jgi:hypothetical protein